MSWNIELVVVEPQVSDFDDIGLLDVSVKRADNLPFWEATSFSALGDGIAASNFDGKTVLIDPSCRLLNAMPSLLRDLKSHKIVFSRVSDQSVCKTFVNGEEKKESFLKALFGKKRQRDGEIEAWQYVESKTGLSMDSSDPCKDLNNSKYAHYVPDEG